MYIYSIRLVVVTSLKCSIGRVKYIYIPIGWIKQQSNSSQVHYSEFHAFDNHQAYIYFIYFFLKSVTANQSLYIYI